MLRHRILRPKLWCHRSIKRWAYINRNIGANNSTHRWKILGWHSEARRQCKVTQKTLFSFGTTQVTRATPTEKIYFKKALSLNPWHWGQSWLCPQSWLKKLNETRGKLYLFLPHQPVMNPQKPKNQNVVHLSNKIRKCSPQRQTSIRTSPVAECNKKIRKANTKWRFRLEAMFLAFSVPGADSRCLQFFWREDQEQAIEIYNCTRHFFGWRTHRVVRITFCIKWREITRTATKIFSKFSVNFIHARFSLKSVRTSQKAIEFYKKAKIYLSKSGLTLREWITSDVEVTDPRGRRINENCCLYEAEPQSGLECRLTQSHCLSWNWTASSSKNNPQNFPFLCLSSVRPTWDTLIRHNKIVVFTYKHLGRYGTSMRQWCVSRTLESFQWLMLWVERIKDDVDISTFFWKRTFKLYTPHFHRCVWYVHYGVSARRSDGSN